ncbi:replication-associated recombination protein A [Geodermatophilus sp. TF02-6]|nr:replication-associated recombination protein A [Geodermatophilus sp. TF02-6]
MRPRSLDEVVGQQHLLGPRAPLRRLVEGDEPMSVVLYGPPGTGKTTLAHVVSLATRRQFVQLSALDAGVKEVRAVITAAKRELNYAGRRTVLFIDEVHRFSRTQQDSLLSAVEDRIVSLVAATTENPNFSVVGPLLSRSLVLALQPLSDDDVRTVLRRALTSDRGLDGAVTLTAEAEEHLVRVAGGDARKALTALESGAGAARAAGATEVDLHTLETAVAQAAVRYDRSGDQHYDIASALIKSIRGSDVDAALHYLARMVEAGEDPRFIARRLVISASEDVGMADPTALQTAVAAADAVAFLGMPEGRIPLAQAVVHLATAPKSNAAYTAIERAIADVRAGLAGPVPPGLRDAHYAGAKQLGHGGSYVYPHDTPDGIVPQQYPPDALVGRDYYRPTTRGAEGPIAARLGKLRAIVRRQPFPEG